MNDIKTVTLNGGELKVEGINGQNTIITNRGTSTVYASTRANVTPDGDGTAAIPPGWIMNLHGTNGTVYLLGTGKVQLKGTDVSWLPISAGGSGGGGGSSGDGVSQAYVDDADALTLKAAKDYTDGEIQTAKTDLETEIGGVSGEIDGCKTEVADIKGYIPKLSSGSSTEVILTYSPIIPSASS